MNPKPRDDYSNPWFEVTRPVQPPPTRVALKDYDGTCIEVQWRADEHVFVTVWRKGERDSAWQWVMPNEVFKSFCRGGLQLIGESHV